MKTGGPNKASKISCQSFITVLGVQQNRRKNNSITYLRTLEINTTHHQRHLVTCKAMSSDPHTHSLALSLSAFTFKMDPESVNKMTVLHLVCLSQHGAELQSIQISLTD